MKLIFKFIKWSILEHSVIKGWKVMKRIELAWKAN